MASERTRLSKAMDSSTNEMKDILKSSVLLCKASEKRAVEMYNEIRVLLNANYMRELELALEINKRTDDTENGIVKIFNAFINEIKENDRHLLIDDENQQLPSSHNFQESKYPSTSSSQLS